MCTFMALERLQTSFGGKVHIYGNFEIFYANFYQSCSFYLYFSIFNKYFFLINISTYSTMVYLNLISRLVVIRIFTKYFITNLSTITKKILLFLYIKLIFNRNDCIKQIGEVFPLVLSGISQRSVPNLSITQRSVVLWANY